MSIFNRIKKILSQESSINEKIDVLIEVVNPPKTEKSKLETYTGKEDSQESKKDETQRSNIVHHIVQVDETMDALDVIHN